MWRPIPFISIFCYAASTIRAADTARLAGSASCENSAQKRACWGAYDISTNYYDEVPNTGRTVEYWLEVANTTASPDGVERSVLAVNGSIPGPTIIANWGDTVKIHVHNALSSNGSTIHWHGIRQNYTNQMDGVPSITQCPIAPGESYTYSWRAVQYGTGWYHSHIGVQAWEGVFGGVIINGPASANYDEDLGILFLNDWSHQTVDQQYESAMRDGPPTMDNGLINGTNTYKNGGSRFSTQITPGKTYRLRLVNAAVDSHFKFSIDYHVMTVVSNDFVPIVPRNVTYISIGMGQRYDVLVTANQASANYWVRAIPQKTCSDNDNANDIRGILRYSSSSADPVSKPYLFPDDCDDMSMSTLVPYLPLSVGSQSASEDLPITAQISSDRVVQWLIQGSTMHVEWGNPTLAQIYASDTMWSRQENVITISKETAWTYFVIQNTNPIPHPIHLHGHDIYLLKQDVGIFSGSFSGIDKSNPTRRDTAMLPGAGYMIIAYKPDNPGAWLMHCHIGWHAAGGFSLQIVERQSEIPQLIDNDILGGVCSRWNSSYLAQHTVQDDSGI